MNSIKSYFSNKRRERLLIYNTEDTYGVHSGKNSIFQFFLTFICCNVMMLLVGKFMPQILPNKVKALITIPALIIAVDWADFIWLKTYKKADKVFFYIKATVVTIVGVLIYLYMENPTFRNAADQFHKDINIKVKENAKKERAAKAPAED